jgi:hypothetical protein
VEKMTFTERAAADKAAKNDVRAAIRRLQRHIGEGATAEYLLTQAILIERLDNAHARIDGILERHDTLKKE